MEMLRKIGVRVRSKQILFRASLQIVRENSQRCAYVTSHWDNRSCVVTKTMPSFFRKLVSCVSMQNGPDLPAEGLVMKTVDCDWMKIINGAAHKTDDYENTALILRRGQTFKVKVTFQRAFNSTGDKVFLEFAIGNDPQLVNDTKVRIGISEALNPAKWSMILQDTDDMTITLEVNIPANAIIGRYKTTVEFESTLQDGKVERSRDKEPDVIIICNAWCKDDPVYIEDEAERHEYVMNDTGNVYRGSKFRISAKKWIFGQFEEFILDAALNLLDEDKRTSSNNSKWLPKRRDPVWLVRVMSAMVNSDKGVLVGNWSGNYEGGNSPTFWGGSVKILQQYFKTKKPVMFGQCWVFSGVMTTLLRALGIPTRSVTNFASAHDTEGSMTIDAYRDEEGEEVELGSDSVWNFHVWNESWMTRSDLPPGYGGWQIIDATPQEISLGLFQTGPAPLTAIKKGEVYLGYETPFVFAEVNSDRITWMVKKDQDGDYIITSLGRRYPSSVGKNISTKKVGSDERQDLTNDYKYPEGSDEERAAFKLAYGFGAQPEYQKGFLALQEEETKDGIDFEFTTTPTDEELFNGDDATIHMTVTNKGSEARTINVTSSLHTTMYTGVKKAFVKRSKLEGITLEPNASTTKEIALSFGEYHGKLVDQHSIKLTAVATVKETGKMFSEDFEFRMENKEKVEGEDIVKIKINDPLKVGQKSTVTVQFTNPLPVKLTHLTATLEGPGISIPITQKMGHLLPGEKTESTFTITPKRKGDGRLLSADVDSRQVQDMKNFIYVDVAAPAPAPVAPVAADETKAEAQAE